MKSVTRKEEGGRPYGALYLKSKGSDDVSRKKWQHSASDRHYISQ